MGCFDVSCFLSRTAIHNGDDCGVIFVKPHGANTDQKDRRNCTIKPGGISQDGRICALFKPDAFIFWGKYNDYGSIKDIRKDAATDFLEKRFAMPITDIVTTVCDRSDYFGRYSNIQKFYGKPWSMTQEGLEALGFTFATPDPDQPCVLSHPLIDIRLPTLKACRREPYPFLWKDNAVWVGQQQPYPLDAEGLGEAFMSITNFILGIPEDKQEIAHEIQRLTALFVRRDTWEAYKAFGRKECDWLVSHVTPEVLEALGFLPTPGLTAPNGEDRYTLHYTHPELPELAIFSDGDRGLAATYKSKRPWPYLGDLLLKLIQEINPGYKPPREIRKLNSCRAAVLGIKRQLLAQKDLESWKRDSITQLYHWQDFHTRFSVDIQSGDYDQVLEEMLLVESSMLIRNDLYFPALHHEQHGDRGLQLKFMAFIHKRLELQQKVDTEGED